MKNALWTIKSYSELSAEELYSILQIRQDVFVVEQNCPYLDADGYDESALHIWAEADGKTAAYCRLFPAGIKYEEISLGRVCTDTSFRQTGLGKTIMKIALDTAEARFRSAVMRISAQDYLLDFYKSFGFSDTGKKYLEDDIPHTEMLRISGLRN